MAETPSWLAQYPEVEDTSWLDQYKEVEEKPFLDISDTLSATVRAFTSLGTTVPSSLQQAWAGLENPWRRSEGYLQQAENVQSLQRELEQANTAAEEAGDISSVSSAVREATPSLGFSFSTLGPSLGAAAATGLATKSPAAARAAGAATSLAMAYRMAGAQFLDDARDQINSFFLEKAGRMPTEAEQEEAYQELLPLARKFGAAEAAPEALGNMALGGAGKYIRKVLGGKAGVTKLATDALGKVTGAKAVAAGVGAAAGEVATEAITQVEQDRIQKQFEESVMKGEAPESVQLPGRTAADYVQGVEEVGPATLAMTGLMGVAGLGPTLVGKGLKTLQQPAPTPTGFEQTTPDGKPVIVPPQPETAVATPQAEGTPVSLSGRNYTVTIPPESSVTPEVLGSLDPDTIKDLADRGMVNLAEVIPPSDVVDTKPLNDNLAASEGLAPKTVATVAEITQPEADIVSRLEQAEQESREAEERSAETKAQEEKAAQDEAQDRQRRYERMRAMGQPEAAQPEAAQPEAAQPEAELAPTVASEEGAARNRAVIEEAAAKARGTKPVSPTAGLQSVIPPQTPTPNAPLTQPVETSIPEEPEGGTRHRETPEAGTRDQLPSPEGGVAETPRTEEVAPPPALTELENYVATLPDTPRSKWTPDVMAKAKQFFTDRKDSTLEGLTKIQKTRIRESLYRTDEAAAAAERQTETERRERLKREATRPAFEAGERVSFKVNGQPVIGTIQRVSRGGSAVVTYNWNGKKEQEIVLRTSELQRPALSLASSLPSYQYTQEQNSRKAARVGIPTEAGVIVDAGPQIRKALERIAADTAMPQMTRAVARALQTQNFDGVDLRIEADGRRRYAGYYLTDDGINEIGINLRQVGRGLVDAVGTFLHEALHHVTFQKVNNPQGEVETQAVQALDTIRKRIRAYAASQEMGGRFSYELSNVDEFITGIFTRPDFQDFVAGIPDTFAPNTPASKFQSVLSEVFRIIANLVTGRKVQKGSLLDQAFASTLTLFETPQRRTEGSVNAYSQIEEGFYSKLAQVIEQKMPNRADAATIKGIITNPQTGIKAEELKWSGIVPWLESQSGPVTKQAVLDYLASDGAVRLEEVRMGDWPQAREPIYEAFDRGEITREERNRRLEQVEKDIPTPAKFAQYQLPGGENYREVVLAMPQPDQWKTKDQFAEETFYRPYDQLDEGDRLWIDELDARQRGKNAVFAAEAKGYTSSHFNSVPNYVAHMRLNDRTDADGQPGTFIEEIQSDRHQAGREKGYSSDPASLPDGYTIEVLSSQDQREKGYTHAAVKNGVRMLYANSAEDAAASATRLENGANPGLRIPDAPFRTTWPLQMFKRALAEAVAQGKQWIGWTTGDTQFDRWGSERFDWEKNPNQNTQEPTTLPDGYEVIKDRTRYGIIPSDQGHARPLNGLHDSIEKAIQDGIRYLIQNRVIRLGGGWIMSGQEQYSGNAGGIDLENLARERGQLLEERGTVVRTKQDVLDLVRRNLREGKAEPIADKIWTRMQTEDSGTTLPRKEGMNGFYDTILPKEIGKYVKQWGAGVVKGSVKTGTKDTDRIGSEFPADMPWASMYRGNVSNFWMTKAEAENDVDQGNADAVLDMREAVGGTPIWRVDITPQMRTAIEEKGQARFSTTQQPEAPTTFTPQQARDILTKRFGAQVADKLRAAVLPKRTLDGREVEIDAEIRDGAISLNLKFLDSGEMIVLKAEHEMAHAVYSDPAVQTAWRDLSMSMPQEVRDRLRQQMAELGYNDQLIDEEVLVRYFEEVRANTPASAWKAFMDKVIDAFRRFFGFRPDERTARLAAARIIYAGESAVARGLDPTKQAFGQSTTDEGRARDADYLAAVQAGDMEKAQRMVDEAARAAGYNEKAYHGSPNKPFWVFDPLRKGERTGSNSALLGFFAASSKDVASQYRMTNRERSNAGYRGPLAHNLEDAEAKLARAEDIEVFAEYDEEEGGYIGKLRTIDPYGSEYSYDADPYDAWGNGEKETVFDDKDVALEAAQDEKDKTIAKAQKALDDKIAEYEKAAKDKLESSTLHDLFLKLENPLIYDFNGGSFKDKSYSELVQEAIDGGHDGVIMENTNDAIDDDATSDVFVFFKSSQAKLADPVTYDNNGNVIPLSKRFKPESPDIRYSTSQYFRPAVQLNGRVIEAPTHLQAWEKHFGKPFSEFGKPEMEAMKDSVIKEGFVTPDGFKNRKEAKAVFEKQGGRMNLTPGEQRDWLDSSDLGDGVRYSVATQRDTTVNRKYPGMISLKTARPFKQVIAEAQQAILRYKKESDKTDKVGRLSDVRSAILKDTSLPGDSRIIALDLLAQEASLMANMSKDADTQNNLDDYSFDTATASGVLESDSTGLASLKFDTIGDLMDLATEAGRVLNIWNAIARLTPEGFLRKQERIRRNKVKEATGQQFGKNPDDILRLMWNEVDAVEKAAVEKAKGELKRRSPEGVAKAAIARLNEMLAGPPRPRGQPSETSQLIRRNTRTPVEGFTDKLVELGVERETADALDAVSATVRAEMEEVARIRAIDRLTKSLQPKTRQAKEAIPRLLRVLLKAGETGAFDSKEFNDALGTAFGLPPMTAEQEKVVRQLVKDINSLPQGAARVDKQQELQDYIAMVEGIPSRDMLLSAWYANVLSGISTQSIGIFGNTGNTALRSAFLALTNHPEDFQAFLRGMVGAGSNAGWQEVKAAMQGKGLFKTSKVSSPQITNALEVLYKKGPTTPAEWVAYFASAGTRLKAVFRIMSAIDAYYWNSTREGMAHLAASRAVRKAAKAAKDRGEPMSEAEMNAEFINQLGGGPEAYEAALRDAAEVLKSKGHPADMATVSRIARENIDRQRPAEIRELSTRFADRIVFQQEPEGIGRLVSKLIEQLQKFSVLGFPLGQMLVPFNKIVSNLFESSIDYTGMGLVRGYLGMHVSDALIDWSKGGGLMASIAPKKGAVVFDAVERRERAMAGLFGLTMSAGAYLLAKASMDEPDDTVPFMLYAFGPQDKNKRAQMPAGWMPFSIKIGDTYLRYSEWPLGMVLAGFASALDAERYGNASEKDTMERIGYATQAGIRGFMTQGVLSNVDTAIDVLMGKATGKKYTDLPVNAVKGMIPAQGLLRDFSTLFDPNKISNDTIRAALLRDLPFAKSIGTRPELNHFGEPIEMEGWPVLRRFGTPREKHPVADYLVHNKLYIPGMDETITVGQYLPADERDRFKRMAMQMNATDNGVFTPEQNYEFRKRVGQLTKGVVERIMQAAPTITSEEQRKAVQSAITTQVGLARRRAMVEAVPYQPPPAR